jgi:hypothetical protein
MALVAVVDPALRSESGPLRRFFHLVSAASAGESSTDAPCEQTHCHRGVKVFLARAMAPFAIAQVGDRIIVANQEALASRLIDSALDGGLLPRAEGDEVVVNGPEAARVIGDAKAILSSGWLKDRFGSEANAKMALDAVERVLMRSREGRLRFDLEGKQVKLDIELNAPDLVPASRPAR